MCSTSDYKTRLNKELKDLSNIKDCDLANQVQKSITTQSVFQLLIPCGQVPCEEDKTYINKI